jgi:hypothetical protein
MFLKMLPLLLLLLPYAVFSSPADSLGTPAIPAPMEFSVAGYYYAFPADDDLAMAVARANLGTLHLEARYNYEDRRTASVFAGWNFAAGESFTVELTPMAGIAFGNTSGIIPALEMSLGYGPLDLYAEGEYLFDLHDSEGNFAYTWLELGFTPADPLRAGLVAQRTRVFRSPLEVDRGLFAQVMPGPATVSVYAFNLFTESWFLTIGFEISI